MDPENQAILKAGVLAFQRQLSLKKIQAAGLCDTHEITEGWFIAGPDAINIEMLEETIRETAIYEWGEGTEVIFESKDKVIVRKQEKEMVITNHQGGSEWIKS